MTGAAKLRSPIVLTHGLLGFDELRVCGRTLAHYFPRIPEMLTAAGNRVLVARVCPTGGVAERSRQLQRFLDQHLPGEAVHLIGHSMGGLDCRYLITRLGMADRVRTLTTVGTPHRGSTFADWGVRRLQRLVGPLLGLLHVPRQAFYDLTTEQCRRFNEDVPDVPRVRYFSIAGHYEGGWRAPQWGLPHRIVARAEGPNDGIVSVASATWGERVEVWDCDHFGLVNWRSSVFDGRGLWKDRSPGYAALTRLLATAEPDTGSG
jgi:triacylglycerol lipase